MPLHLCRWRQPPLPAWSARFEVFRAAKPFTQLSTGAWRAVLLLARTAVLILDAYSCERSICARHYSDQERKNIAAGYFQDESRFRRRLIALARQQGFLSI
jgi:hypothetical protein